MTNEQRRQALAKARALALEHAETAEKQHDHHFDFRDAALLANMWSAIAGALKTGGPADAVIPDPIDLITTR